MQPPEHTIEDFAELCALVDNGATGRATVLAEAGLDDAGWHHLRAKWLPMLADASVPEIAQRFGRAYGLVRSQRGRAPAAPAVRSTQAQLLFELDGDTECNPQPPVHDPDRTSDLAYPLAGPATPFKNAALLPVTWLLLHGEPPRRSAPRASERDATDVTLDLDGAHLPAVSVLPFVVPDGASAGRRLRLQRFDPQTGQRLDPPIWVWMDEP
jgi:hypothetical protein